MKKLKEVELVLDDIDKGITAMGFVKTPAIEKNMVYFNSNNKNYTLASNADIEQGIIVGPALIPDKRIYRYDETTNEEYNVFFSKETIKKLSMQFLIDGFQNNITEQHLNKVDDIYLIYSWIVENQHDPIITKYNFTNIPDGTWVLAYKINNEDIKSKIKAGEIKGLSIEGYLSEKFGKKSSEEIIINKIKDLLKTI